MAVAATVRAAARGAKGGTTVPRQSLTSSCVLAAWAWPAPAPALGQGRGCGQAALEATAVGAAVRPVTVAVPVAGKAVAVAGWADVVAAVDVAVARARKSAGGCTPLSGHSSRASRGARGVKLGRYDSRHDG
jgi:hypothetical protein